MKSKVLKGQYGYLKEQTKKELIKIIKDEKELIELAQNNEKESNL